MSPTPSQQFKLTCNWTWFGRWTHNQHSFIWMLCVRTVFMQGFLALCVWFVVFGVYVDFSPIWMVIVCKCSFARLPQMHLNDLTTSCSRWFFTPHVDYKLSRGSDENGLSSNVLIHMRISHQWWLVREKHWHF